MLIPIILSFSASKGLVRRPLPKNSLVEGFSLAQIKDITNATVTYEADTGQTWVINEAFCADTLTVTGGDGGKVPVKFIGQPAEEMMG